MKASTWTLDTAHSSIGFAVRHMVFAKVRGRFGRWTAQFALDPDDLTRSTVTAEIDATSIDTGVTDRDNHLRSADFLDAENHPHLIFKSNRVERVGSGYRVVGDLTLHGVTREVVLDVERAGEAVGPDGNRRIAFTATTSLNRTDFGLVWNQVLEAGGVLVGERVDIELDVQAVSAAASQAA